jgi:hypothetical protein
MSNIPDSNTTHTLGVLTKEFRRLAKTITNLYGLPFLATQTVAWKDPEINTIYQLSSMQEPGQRKGTNLIQLYVSIVYPDGQTSETAYVTYENKVGCTPYYVKMTREQKFARDLMRSQNEHGMFIDPDPIDPTFEMDFMIDLLNNFIESPNNLMLWD